MSTVGERQNCHEIGAGTCCYNPPAAGWNQHTCPGPRGGNW